MVRLHPSLSLRHTVTTSTPLLTMFFAIAAAALIAFSQVARATPLTSLTTTVKPVSNAVTIGAHLPVHELRIDSAVDTVQAKVTHPSASGLHSDAAGATFPATLLLCPTANCASCFAFDLSTLPVDQCLVDQSSSFTSMGIVQPSNEGLPFAVVVAPPGCPSLLQIPTVNQCFNINGGALSDFAIIE